MENSRSINNMNGVTNDSKIRFSYTNTNGKEKNEISYSMQNMNGVSNSPEKRFNINNMCGKQ